MNLNQRIFKNLFFYIFLISITMISIPEMNKSFGEVVEPYCIDLNRHQKLITIHCGNVHLSDIDNILSARSVLTQETVGNWQLRADILVKEKGNLIIDSSDTKTLKIETLYGITSYGNLVIDSVKIVSWDFKMREYPTTNGIQPRSYITHGYEGIVGGMNITNSELAFLGFDEYSKQGISYFAGDGSIFSNNHVHDSWQGITTANVGFVTIENNFIHDIEMFGLNHSFGSHDLTIRNNTISYIREGIGIVCSGDCENILIEENRVFNSKEAGIMLYQNANNSIIKDNFIFNQTIGISIADSSNNHINNNMIHDVVDGIQVKVLNPEIYTSQENRIFGNKFSKIEGLPIFIDTHSIRNNIFQNSFDKKDSPGVFFSPLTGPGNLVSDSIFVDSEKILQVGSSEISELGALRIGLIDNSFTRTANQKGGIESFLFKNIDQPQTFVTSDLHMLQSPIIKKNSPQVLSFQSYLEQISPNSEISFLRDEDIHKNLIFNTNQDRLFDVLILFSQEFVSQDEYDNLKRFVEMGGKIIFLDGGIFVAEIVYDEARNSIQFKKGKNWEFDGNLAQKSGWERYQTQNQEWIGSNSLSIENENRIQFLNNPFGNNFSQLSFISNSNAEMWHDFGAIASYKLPDEKTAIAKVGIYQLDFGQGKILMLGISSSSLIEDKKFQDFFKNYIFPKFLGEQYFIDQFEQYDDLKINWILNSGKISDTIVDLKLNAITLNLERSDKVNDNLKLVLPQTLLHIKDTGQTKLQVFVDHIPVDANPILTDTSSGFEIPLRPISSSVKIIGDELGFFDDKGPEITINNIDFIFNEDYQEVSVDVTVEDYESGVNNSDLFLEKIPTGEIFDFANPEDEISNFPSLKMDIPYDAGTTFKIIATATDYLNNRSWIESEIFESYGYEDSKNLENSTLIEGQTKDDAGKWGEPRNSSKLSIHYPSICKPLNQIGDIIVKGSSFDEKGIAKIEALIHKLPHDGSFDFQPVTPISPGNWSQWSINFTIPDEKQYRILVESTNLYNKKMWAEVILDDIFTKKTLNSHKETSGKKLHAFLYPTFTSGVYNLDSFYFFYSKYSGATSSEEITTDLDLLTGKVPSVPDVGYFQPLLELVQEYDPGSDVSIITDNYVHNGLIFNENGDNLYESLFVLHDEYVTQESYENLKKFVQNGGVIVFLDGNIFYGEVELDEENCTVTLVKGHDWEFDGQVAKKSVSERYFDENQTWMGSNFIINQLDSEVIFGNNPFDYRHFEENHLTNPKALILIDYLAEFLYEKTNPDESIEDIELKLDESNNKNSNFVDSPRVATYELDYGKGKVIMMGIYAERLSENTEFQKFFQKIVLPRAIGNKYPILLESEKFDIFWEMRNGKVTHIELNNKEKNLTLELNTIDSDKSGSHPNTLIVLIPKQLLDSPTPTNQGNYDVFLDGKPVEYNQVSDDFERSIEIQLPPNSGRVEIFGKNILSEQKSFLEFTSELINRN